MKIAVIGSGYVGLVVGICLADLGNDVICVDINEEKIARLRNGELPIYEPGLGELLVRNLKENRMSFTTDLQSAVKNSEIIFIAVWTPLGENGAADLSSVRAVATDIGKAMTDYKVVVNKSTVPVGTAEIVSKIIKENLSAPCAFDVVSNPEFLRQGSAVRDFLSPDRIVIGVDSSKAKEVMENLYKGISRTGKPIMFTDTKSAEIIKYASNSMLASRISFMNEVSQLCEKVGGDVKEVAKGMGLDERIGPRFLQAGVGYGGSCFSKDVQAFIYTAQQHGVNFKILESVERVNEDQKKSLVPKLKEFIPDLKGKTIGLWGLAFKPRTDDMRGAPSITIIKQLQENGAKVKAFDPEAVPNAKKVLSDVEYASDLYGAVDGCDALILVTEWNEFRNPDFDKIKKLMKSPIIIDGRNIYDPDRIRKLGFKYKGIGR